MSELKKCPFCGGEATIYGSKTGYGVMCKDKTFCAVLPAGFSTKEKAITAWNTRKPVERILERLEERAEDSKKYWDKFGDYDELGAMDAYYNAIEIIKEEDGL